MAFAHSCDREMASDVTKYPPTLEAHIRKGSPQFCRANEHMMGHLFVGGLNPNNVACDMPPRDLNLWRFFPSGLDYLTFFYEAMFSITWRFRQQDIILLKVYSYY